MQKTSSFYAKLIPVMLCFFAMGFVDLLDQEPFEC